MKCEICGYEHLKEISCQSAQDERARRVLKSKCPEPRYHPGHFRDYGGCDDEG